MRADVIARKIPAEELRGYTITLSNFGMIGAKYAAPIVTPPPTVAIPGAGRIRDQVVAADGQPAVHRVLPATPILRPVAQARLRRGVAESRYEGSPDRTRFRGASIDAAANVQLEVNQDWISRS